MKLSTKQWVYIYGVAVVILVWGLSAWFSAKIYQPDDPVLTPFKPFSDFKDISSYPLKRYNSLLSGRLFFGGPDTTVINQFRSAIVLWGVIKGEAAIVGFDPRSNQNTILVKPGETIQGEKITVIGDNYIIVRNSSGGGKIRLIGE